MISTPTARLAARLAIAALVGVGLVGGAASAASAAAAPVGSSSERIAPPASFGPVVTASPTLDPVGTRLPDLPLAPVDPCPTHGDCPKPDPCKGVTPGATDKCPKPDPCQQLRSISDHCRPDPCRNPRTGEPQDCESDPCVWRRGNPLPEGCRPEPCFEKNYEGERLIRHEPSRRPEPDDCKPPKGCGDADRCDRPVPGKPTFTG